MRPFKHVLCPVDFSDFSRRALILARGIAHDFQAELTVYHVVDTAVLSLGNTLPLQDVYSTRHRRAEEAMASLKSMLELARSRTEVVNGIPHRMIASKAKESGADLVVMGTHGASGFEKLFLGSVTEKVLHQIEAPLLTVTRPTGSTLPDAERGEAVRFRTIMMAVDFEPGAVATAEHALALARRYGAKILALHVYPQPSTFYATAAATRVMDEDRVRSGRQLELEKLVPASIRDTVPTEFLTLKGDPFEVIDRVARERGVDLVVMGARSHGVMGWLGCTTHKVIRAGACPVLAVRKGP